MDMMGDIADIGRRPTIQRCDDCIWGIVAKMHEPDKVESLVKMLNTPPGENRAPIQSQEKLDYE